MIKKTYLSIFIIMALFLIGIPVYAAENYKLTYDYNEVVNEETNEKSYYATVNGIEAESKYDYLDIVIPDAVKNEGNEYLVTNIGASAFSGENTKDKVNINSITLGKNVTTIENSAFANNTTLTAIYKLNSLETIEAFAFSGCSSLKNVKFYENLKSIGISAFENCSKMRLLDLNDCSSLTVIESKAFAGCIKIEAITIPENVKKVGEGAFDIHTAYKKVVLNYNAIEAVEFKDVFNKLDTVYLNLGDKVKSIPNDFLRNCGIHKQSIVFPKTIEYLGDKAFYYATRCTYYFPADCGLKIDSVWNSDTQNVYYADDTELPEAHYYTVSSIEEEENKETTLKEKEEFEKEYYAEVNTEVEEEKPIDTETENKVENEVDSKIESDTESKVESEVSEVNTSESTDSNMTGILIIVAIILFILETVPNSV